jgi:hypothetical protein
MILSLSVGFGVNPFTRVIRTNSKAQIGSSAINACGAQLNLSVDSQSIKDKGLLL